MMKKSMLAVLAVLILPWVSENCRAQTAATPLDYYKLGQFLEWCTFFKNVASFPNKSEMRGKLDLERQVLLKMNAPAAVLNAYDHMVNALISLPFDTDYSSWTPTQQTQFANSSPDFNVFRTWLGTGDTTARFYYFLGSDTEYAVKDGPASLNSWGVSLANVQANYKPILTDYALFTNSYPNSFPTAVPAVQAAIKALAAYNGKTVSAADLAAVQQLAQPIYDAANGKISQ
jgi:hypothetical protein